MLDLRPVDFLGLAVSLFVVWRDVRAIPQVWKTSLLKVVGLTGGAAACGALFMVILLRPGWREEAVFISLGLASGLIVAHAWDIVEIVSRSLLRR